MREVIIFFIIKVYCQLNFTEIQNIDGRNTLLNSMTNWVFYLKYLMLSTYHFVIQWVIKKFVHFNQQKMLNLQTEA